MYLSKMMKKLATALCLLAVVGMLAACSNSSGSGSSDSGSDTLNNDEQYTILYKGEPVFGGTMTGKEFSYIVEDCGLKAGTDYKVDNSKKTITITDSGAKKLSTGMTNMSSSSSGINVKYIGIKGTDVYTASFKGEEKTDKVNGEVVKNEVSGTFTVYADISGIKDSVCVCEGTFKDGNPEEDCTIKIEVTKKMNKTTGEMETLNPSEKSDLVIKDKKFTYDGIEFGLMY